MSLVLGLASFASAQPATGHSFAVSKGQFTLDGKPFRVLSGEMHYPRIPRAYWRERLRMAKAMGLNTVTTYVFWNVHE
ncbi:MAG TPA: beta-galactosidase, partial [Edaphobacter sp.]|nr:beta-galactosidase [Edaphobacter sp.]